MRMVTPNQDEVIERQQPALDAQTLEKFRWGTDTRHTKSIPMTLATIWRHPEFDWLNKLEVDMHDLLHADQEYRYLSPFVVGDRPLVRTWVSSLKERKGKQFSLCIVELTSDILCQSEKRMTTVTTFVVKSAVSTKPESE